MLTLIIYYESDLFSWFSEVNLHAMSLSLSLSLNRGHTLIIGAS